MRDKRKSRWLQSCRLGLSALALGQFIASPVLAAGGEARSPIKHVIVIIGENRSFDHIFATYKPVNAGEKVLNLLSQGIVNSNGAPGPNYGKAVQYNANDYDVYHLAPPQQPYTTLPPATVGGTKTPYVCEFLGVTTGTSCNDYPNGPHYTALIQQKLENGLEPEYQQYLLTGGTGQTNKTPDLRVNYDGQTATTLPPGPYQLTNSVNPSYPMPYDAYTASPVHRFMQMQQQLDCDASNARRGESFGCTNGLYAWVEETVGAGSNGKAQPSPFTTTTTGEGSTALGFYNVQQGDAPYFKHLADTYAMSDNFHQSVNGGTGANHIMLGTGDAIYFSDANLNAATPVQNPVNPANPSQALPGYSNALSEIENPNPQPGTNNYYTQDGYGGGNSSPAAPTNNTNYGGGSYVNCSDKEQPGVGERDTYLRKLPDPVKPNCDKGHFYLVNNYNPGFFGDGSNAYTDTNPSNTVYTVPPSRVKTIGDLLIDHQVSWAYYGDQFDRYLDDKYDQQPTNEYCNICNWAQYDAAIMTNPEVRKAHLKDTTSLYAGIREGDIPAVSYVKPSGLVDGHPASSKVILFEGFVKKIVDEVQANPLLRENTVVFVTFDEGGGYWDSGYVQPLDFFGDGTRIPLIAVSKYSKGGHISHDYADHVSISKFIERNWRLPPITHRSRDNLPNPTYAKNDYVPVNAPALGDLWDLFDFGDKH
ncbi:MAG: phosphoesterase [Hyphomicrobiales bacterium]|nr:phosphoesterase [Hyphomicrobiales bacterium]